MILFADASALVAAIANEAGSEAFTMRLAEATERIYSPVSEWEAVAGLCRSYDVPPDIARLRVRSFLDSFDFRQVSIGAIEGQAALDAYQNYGKGRHPAALNMGDCFAYACACAKVNGAALLYKGDDFARTDLA